MLFIRTGLPGSSKTLNTLREICHDKGSAKRDIYYNNIKLLMLDFDVVSSFQGFFYGEFYPTLDKKHQPKYQKILLKIHDQDELVSPEDFPHLRAQYDAWLETGGHIQLWLYWVRRTHPSSKLSALEDYLNVVESPTVDDLKQFKLHWNDFPDPTTWPDLPRHSIVVVDECQRWFPVRPVGAKVPRHVSEFETHRHKGLDIHLVTQDAKLLDSHVRRLVGRHIHFSNPLASKKISRMEHDKVFDPSDYHQRKNATKAVKSRDSKFYGLYWSADVHTHKARIPKFLYLLIPAAIVPFWVAYYFSTLGDDNSSAQVQNPVVTEQQVNDVDSFKNFPTTEPESAQSSEIKHFDELIEDDTPLSSYCDRVTYAGKETISRHGQVTTNYYLQCERDSPDSGKSTKSDDEDGDSKSLPATKSDSYLLGYRFLTALGFELEVVQGMPLLRYKQNLYAFPPL
jgi:hypothetical protein